MKSGLIILFKLEFDVIYYTLKDNADYYNNKSNNNGDQSGHHSPTTNKNNPAHARDKNHFF